VQVAFGLADGADQEGGRLDEFLVLLLLLQQRETAADVQSFAVGKDDAPHAEELLQHSPQKVRALACHIIIMRKITINSPQDSGMLQTMVDE
jgi:hypothetical protein